MSEVAEKNANKSLAEVVQATPIYRDAGFQNPIPFKDGVLTTSTKNSNTVVVLTRSAEGDGAWALISYRLGNFQKGPCSFYRGFVPLNTLNLLPLPQTLPA